MMELTNRCTKTAAGGTISPFWVQRNEQIENIENAAEMHWYVDLCLGMNDKELKDYIEIIRLKSKAEEIGKLEAKFEFLKKYNNTSDYTIALAAIGTNASKP